MTSKSKANNKPFIILSLLLFALFATLAFYTPYTNDDWAWGDQIGADRLANFFAGYNGRYLGNLLILLISNSRFALVACMAVSYCAACLIPCFFSKSTTLSTLLFSAILFFLLPKSIYAQIVSWASGYSNYMPPVLLLALYYVIIKNIFDDEKTSYPKLMPVLTLVIGFAGALFMENITLTNIAIGALIILYVLIKEKKLYLTHVAFLVGAVAGAAVMFTNTAYGIIGNGGDDYRSIASGKTDMITTIVEHVNVAVNHMFVWNIWMCAVASAVFVAVCALYIKSSDNKKAVFATKLIAAANLFALGMLFVKYKYQSWTIYSEKAMEVFMWGVVGLYCLSLFAGIILCVKDKASKFKLLLLFVTVACMVAPLMIVNPITARCYYPPYFIMSMMVIEMFAYAMREAQPSESTQKAIGAAFVGGLCALSIFYLSIFSTIHAYDNMRSEYIEKQNANHEQTVMVTTLPYDDYLWTSSPGSKMWIDRFKIYYDIDENAEMKYIDDSKYKKFAEKYDQEHPVSQNQ
ncbi:MAG: hypothetical protein IKF64_04870 [Eubacterium sp.]|nr:hypothetical protein [Eubacterium sp.]